MPRDLVLRKQDLFTNPTPRLPICLVLDRSPSMSGDPALGAPVPQSNPRPIDELNRGVAQFFTDVCDDEIAVHSAEVSIVGFADEPLRLLDFDSILRVSAPIIELAGSGTSLGSAVEMALDLLTERKQEYQEVGVDYYQPWLVLMTDGVPTDRSHLAAARRVQDLLTARKLVVFPIGIGQGVDMDVLAAFASADRRPLHLRGIAFAEFFAWLSQSVQRVSQSIPGESPTLPKVGWADPDDPDEPW
jgi:uncharacterized protein YegL